MGTRVAVRTRLVGLAKAAWHVGLDCQRAPAPTMSGAR